MAVSGCLRSGEAHIRKHAENELCPFAQGRCAAVICIECRTGLNFAGRQMRMQNCLASLWHVLEALKSAGECCTYPQSTLLAHQVPYVVAESASLQITHADSKPPTPRWARTISRCPPIAQKLVFTLGQQGCLGVRSPNSLDVTPQRAPTLRGPSLAHDHQQKWRSIRTTQAKRLPAKSRLWFHPGPAFLGN